MDRGWWVGQGLAGIIDSPCATLVGRNCLSRSDVMMTESHDRVGSPCSIFLVKEEEMAEFVLT